MSNTILNTDFLQPKDAWDALPLQQKAEMMRVAIRNGIHDLPTIRQKYNEFAEGGIMEENLYAKGGPKKQYGNAGSQKAMQFFMNKGLTQAQAAGLVGNLMRESGMKPTALNSSSKAYGIAQWLGSRKKALFAKYGSNPTFDQQLDFVWHELNTTHKNGLRHLKASKTAAEAARNAMGYYEFSAGPEAAIAAMNRTGQAGNKSMQIGIENASKLLGVPVPTGEYVQQEVPVTTEIPQNIFQFTPWNPQVFYGNQAYQTPQIELPLEQAVPETTPIITQEQLEKAEKQQRLDTFAALSNLFQPSSDAIDTSNVLVNPQKRTNPYVAYQNGGNLFDLGGRSDVYNNKRIYEILPKLYALDGVNTVLSSGLRSGKGSIVIENGKSTGRVSRHASGQAADIVPGKGSTFADMFRVLRDPNSHVSRYLQSLGGGYIDETSATGTTKYWHDHDSDHSHIHHQIGGGAASKYKSEIASILKGSAPAIASTQAAFPTFDFVPSNPQAFFTPIENFQQPIERPVIQAPTAEDLAREQRMQEIEERRENLNRFGLLLGLSSPSQKDNSLMQTIGLLSGNMSAHGGHIHIAPSKKGTFTAAATKHGMGVQEFASKVLAHPENYSSAMRKKANFARNASKWHGLGGNLYDGTSQPTQQMDNSYSYTKPLSNVYVDSEGNVLDPDVPSARGTVQLPEVTVATPDWKDVVGRYSIASNDATTISGLRPQNTHLKKQAEEGAAKHAAWSKENPGLETIGLIAGAAPFAVAATPAIVGGGELAYPILTNPYVDKGIASAFAGHGLNHAINEGIDGWGDAAMTALELTPLGRLAKPMYNAGIDAAANGRRFMLDVGDRYQGMKDAAAYRGANEIKDANMKWLESHGKSAGINRMGVNYDGSFGIYYPNNSKAGHWYSPVVEKGGEMTLTTHLGGDFPGEYSKDILPMSKSEIAATVKYLRGVPEHTYFGEVGKTKNYAEQYFNGNPSRIKAFRDAIHGKKEINEPYWNEKEHITYFMNEADPIEQAYYRHQYEANEPLSVDSYKLILQEAAKDNGKFALRYDSSPMGMFNPQGVYGEEFYNSLQSLTPEEQVKAINDWMRSYYPKARPAYLKNGKVMIPRPLLMLRSSK